jgi:hypothetical protein
MNKLIAISTLVLAVGIGGWCGYQAGSAESSAPVANTDTPALAKLVPGLSAGRADIDSGVLRALIREEMTAVLNARAGSNLATPASAGKSGSGTAGPTPGQDAVSPETLAQRREAQEQIDTMLSQGVWGNEQRLSFQQKLVVLDADQKEHALQQLITSMNNGTLQVRTDGPPL